MTRPISEIVRRTAEGFRNNLRDRWPTLIVSMFLAIKPVPASRPRVTRFNNVYYGKPYKRFYDDAREWFTDGNAGPLEAEDGPMLAMIEIIAEKPKSGKLDYPKGDVDNFAKGPLDALTNKQWEERPIKDDNQIVGLFTFKRYALPGETPGVRIDYAPAV